MTVSGLYPLPPEFHYGIDARNEKGQPAPPTAYSRSLTGGPDSNLIRGGSAGMEIVEPGKSYTDSDLILTKLYNITILGKYTVHLTATWDELPQVKSNVITILVTQIPAS
jgi:hypothetical protein